MRSAFQQEMDTIQDQLITISATITTRVHTATHAIEESNLELADSLINAERIENLAAQLQQLVVRVLVLQQPMASDFRNIISTLGIATALKNMAEMTWHLAELVHTTAPHPTITTTLHTDFTELGHTNTHIAEHLHHLLSHNDPTTATTILELDTTTDTIYQRVLNKLLSPTWNGTTPEAVTATLALRYYKRISHNAVIAVSRSDYHRTGQWTTEPISNLS